MFLILETVRISWIWENFQDMKVVNNVSAKKKIWFKNRIIKLKQVPKPWLSRQSLYNTKISEKLQSQIHKSSWKRHSDFSSSIREKKNIKDGTNCSVKVKNVHADTQSNHSNFLFGNINQSLSVYFLNIWVILSFMIGK